jgi:hypothetical protein
VGSAINAAAVITAFRNMVGKLVARFEDRTGQRLAMLTVGNEVNFWLDDDPATRVTQFAAFLSGVASAIPVTRSTCFSFSAVAAYSANSYATVTAAVTLPSFTYYPVNADYTLRDFANAVGGMGDDFSALATAISGGPFFLQEIGCSSSPTLGSSEVIQQFFVQTAVFVMNIYANAGLLKGATFLWLSDLSDALLTSQGYTGNAKAFLGSIGYRSQTNDWKPGAYDVALFLNGTVPFTGPIVQGSTSTLFAEIDSTQLGTAFYKPGQSCLVKAQYLVGADQALTWQFGMASSTSLSAGVDEVFAKTKPNQTAQYQLWHTLERNARLRIRQQSSAANGSAVIRVEQVFELG